MNCEDCEYYTGDNWHDGHCDLLGIEVDADEEACAHVVLGGENNNNYR